LELPPLAIQQRKGTADLIIGSKENLSRGEGSFVGDFPPRTIDSRKGNR